MLPYYLVKIETPKMYKFTFNVAIKKILTYFCTQLRQNQCHMAYIFIFYN